MGDDYDRSQLEREFRKGLEALQEAVEEREVPVDDDVRPIEDKDTNVIVRLGTWPTEKYRQMGVDYTDEEYVVFVQIPKRFPIGNGKGFITSPPLDRRDQRELANNPWNDELAQIVEQEVESPAKAYSHNWSNTSMSEGEDMVKFLDVADEFLSRG